MSNYDRMVSAEAWEQLVENLKELGPNPPESEVMTMLLSTLWATEGITLDEDHREATS